MTRRSSKCRPASYGTHGRFLPRVCRRPIYFRPGGGQSCASVTYLRWGRSRNPRLPLRPCRSDPEAKVEEALFHMMSGAMDVLADAGASLVGGHTSGSRAGAWLRSTVLPTGIKFFAKAGMQAGDRLILTKPLRHRHLVRGRYARRRQGPMD